MRNLFRPPHIVWLLGHVILFLLGITVISVDAIRPIVGNAIADGVGASLIATGVAGYVLYLYVALSSNMKEVYSLLQTAGIQKTFDGRSVLIKHEYHDRIRKAKEIDIIGFGLASFRQDYGDQFADWSRTKKIRIILIDPSFPAATTSIANLRDAEENSEIGRIASEVNQFIEVYRKIPREPGGLQVRLMTALPSVNYFRIDSEAFWGPYLVGHPSRNMPTLLVRQGGFVYSRLASHFEALWGNNALTHAPEN